MKKYLLLIVLLLCPAFIFADMGAPEYPILPLIVSKKDGIKMYSDKKDKKSIEFAYGDKIVCDFFYYDSNSITCYLTKDGIEYEGDFNTDEVIPEVDEINEENIENVFIINKQWSSTGNYYKYDKEETYVVLKDIDEAYKGPYDFFGKVDIKIPKGTLLKCLYYTDEFSLIKYNGKSAWIRSMSINGRFRFGSDSKIDGRVALVEENDLITYKDITLKDYPNGNSINVAIPSGTKIKSKYAFYSLKRIDYYIEYNGQGGWIQDEKTCIKVESKLLVNTDIKLNTLDDKKTKDIKKETVFDYYYVDMCSPMAGCTEYGYYLFEIDGEIYKYHYDYADPDRGYTFIEINFLNFESSTKYTVKGNITLYEDPLDKKVLKEFKFDDNKEVKCYAHYYDNSDGEYFFVDIDGTKGWILEKDTIEYQERLAKYRGEDKKTSDDKDEEKNKEKFEDKERVKDTDKNKEVKPNEKSTSVKEYVLYCVAGAVVVAIVAFVTIKFVNKKKKGNTQVEGNTLPEQPVVEQPVENQNINTEEVNEEKKKTSN